MKYVNTLLITVLCLTLLSCGPSNHELNLPNSSHSAVSDQDSPSTETKQTETISSFKFKPMDILIVMDNSPSMKNQQNK